MTVYVGTSGYNYPEWRGTFYPEKFPTAKMLPYYAERFHTVEINYTFYRMPNEKMLGGWAAGTPDGFPFTLKAPRRITHDATLRDCGDLVAGVLPHVARTLGPKLGALLFQLPPNVQEGPRAVLRAFLETCPRTGRARRSSSGTRPGSTHDVFARCAPATWRLCVADSEKMSARRSR